MLLLLQLTVFVATLSYVSAGQYRMMCYYTNWAQWRKGGTEFLPEHIPPTLCTHIIFSFTFLNKETLLVDKREFNDFEMYGRFNALKKKNPALKTMLAVGGWTHPNELFTKATSTPQHRRALADSVVNVMNKYGFDGFDLDWEYPGSRGSGPQTKYRFTDLCKDLRARFAEEEKKTGKRLLLSAAVAAGKDKIEKAYEIEKIAKYLDYINLMAYDLHGSWDGETNSNAPLYPRPTDKGDNRTLNVQWAAQHWKRAVQAAQRPASMINLGLASYGRSFKLASPAQHGVGAPTVGDGQGGVVTEEAGFMSYIETCQFGGKLVWDQDGLFPYRYKGDQWVGFDNKRSLTEKVKFLKQEGFGGAMFWALDLDDYKGQFCNEGPYPLISHVTKLLNEAK